MRAATDGSSLGNPGPGGWGWVTEDGRSGSAGARHCTNNRMELRALIELLEKDPAPPETFASDHYRLNLFAQRWLQSRTRKRLRELMRLVKQLPRSQVVRDLTLIRFLESAKRSPLDFLLPDRLRKLFYHRGVPALR